MGFYRRRLSHLDTSFLDIIRLFRTAAPLYSYEPDMAVPPARRGVRPPSLSYSRSKSYILRLVAIDFRVFLQFSLVDFFLPFPTASKFSLFSSWAIPTYPSCLGDRLIKREDNNHTHHPHRSTNRIVSILLLFPSSFCSSRSARSHQDSYKTARPG